MTTRAGRTPSGAASSAVRVTRPLRARAAAREPDRVSARHRAPGAGLAALASLALVVLLGQPPRNHPVVPALHFGIPGLSSATAPSSSGTLSLPRIAPIGSFLTLHGQLPAGESGTVTVEGAYVRPPWHLLASVPAGNGSYEARIPLDRVGLLHLRVTFPDGHRSVGEVRVG